MDIFAWNHDFRKIYLVLVVWILDGTASSFNIHLGWCAISIAHNLKHLFIFLVSIFLASIPQSMFLLNNVNILSRKYNQHFLLIFESLNELIIIPWKMWAIYLALLTTLNPFNLYPFLKQFILFFRYYSTLWVSFTINTVEIWVFIENNDKITVCYDIRHKIWGKE